MRHLFLFMLLLLGGCQTEQARVHYGELNLSQYDGQQPVRLEGEWLYYPHFLLQSYPDAGPVPNPRWQYVPSNLAENVGFGTYELRLTLPQDGEYLLNIGRVSSVGRVWVNGHMVAEQGDFDLLASRLRPRNHNSLVRLVGPQQLIQIEIINYELHSMGLRLPLILGEQFQLHKALQVSWFIDSALLAILLFVGFYHCILWLFLRQRMPELLPFSMISFSVAVHMALNSDILLVALLMDLNWQLLTRIQYLSIVLGSAALSRYLLYYCGDGSVVHRILRLNYLFGWAYALCLAIMPFGLLVVNLAFIQLYALATALWILTALFTSQLQQQKMFWLIAPVFILSIVNDVLFYQSLSPYGPLAGWGFAVVLILQSTSIISKLTASWNNTQATIEQQTAGFKRYIAELEQQANANLQRNQLALQNLYQDPLTGLTNRTHFEAELQALISHQQYCPSLYLVLINIRKFRQLNIEQGYTQGDQVLKGLAMELQQDLRPQEACGRWQADQFVLLTQQEDDLQIRQRLQRLQQRLDHSEIAGIELNYGYSQWQKFDTGHSLLQRAECHLEAQKLSATHSAKHQ